MIVAGV